MWERDWVSFHEIVWDVCQLGTYICAGLNEPKLCHLLWYVLDLGIWRPMPLES